MKVLLALHYIAVCMLSTSVAATPMPADTLSNQTSLLPHSQTHILQKRSPVILGLGVYAFIEAAGSAAGLTLGDLANTLMNVFKPNEAPWENTDEYCTIYIRTQGGGNCHMEVDPSFAGQEKVTHEDWDCAWVDTDADPPMASFSDPGIGEYRVQFTATDGSAFDGSEECVADGLCYPRLEFQRDGFYMRIDSWTSEGDISEGQYTGDYGGVCQNYVEDQFTTGGNKLATKCAVPCENQNVLPDSTP